jgi:hypothetical protein
MFENRVLRRIFGQEVGEKCIIRSFITCILIAKYEYSKNDQGG